VGEDSSQEKSRVTNIEGQFIEGRSPFEHLELRRVAQAFDLAAITNTVGAPFLRVLCEGAGTTNVCRSEAPPASRIPPSTMPIPLLNSSCGI
jgi:hypothetical protein